MRPGPVPHGGLGQRGPEAHARPLGQLHIRVPPCPGVAQVLLHFPAEGDAQFVGRLERNGELVGRAQATGLQPQLEFYPLPLQALGSPQENIFAAKTKSLEATLSHSRYSSLRTEILDRYSTSLDQPVGSFLLKIKNANDPFYRRFLNGYGDLKYIKFNALLENYSSHKGIYRYLVKGEVKYIGRSRDSFRKRIGMGYGNISPASCYLTGRNTDCLLNALITYNWQDVQLEVCPLEVPVSRIEALEQYLIQKYDPAWNAQGTTHGRPDILKTFSQPSR